MVDHLAAQIRAARVETGISRERLAAELGVSLSTIVRYETGRTGVSVLQLRKIAQATGKPLTYFLEAA